MRKLTAIIACMRPVLLALLVSAAPIVSQAAEQTIFYHLDALGSPIAATDEGGNLFWREEYRPYGDKIQNDSVSRINSRGFTGHTHDNTTGLTYAGARHYDPLVGRFMGVDPVPFAQTNLHSFNRYIYGNNNPYKYVDPDGQWSTEAHNYFVDQAFSTLSPKIRGYMKEGSRLADALPNQLAGRDHRHSMWGEFGSMETMERARSRYISARLRDFGELMSKSTEYRSKGVTQMADDFEKRAWIEYGKALHPIMDSTSPVHNQEWRLLSDFHFHGDYRNSRESRSLAPAYRDETVRRMQNVAEFIQQ